MKLSSVAPIVPALAVLALTMTFVNGVTPDSHSYLEAAKNLSKSGYIGEKFLLWPPLYPALLSLHAKFSADLDQFAVFVGRLLMLLTIFGVWALGARLTSSRFGLSVALLALACAPTLHMVFTFTWSENLYIPLCVWTTFFGFGILPISVLRICMRRACYFLRRS